MGGCATFIEVEWKINAAIEKSSMASLVSPVGGVFRSGTLPWRLPLMVVAAVLALRLGSDATANVSYFLVHRHSEWN